MKSFNLSLISRCALSGLILFAFGCAGVSKKANIPQTVTISFKGRVGEATDTRYFSNAHILNYDANQLVKDRSEAVEFTVTSRTTAVREGGNILAYDSRTIAKDGVVSLHDLAFPELGETVDYLVRSTGEVLKAGAYSPQSLFFVPALPLPLRPVDVGETWSLLHTWISARDGVPLKLDVIGILKGIVICEKDKLCADIELSGSVRLIASPTVAGAKFESHLWGRILFSLERGDVLWSDMRSREEMGIGGNLMKVISCMVSEMKTEATDRTKLTCEPTDQTVISVPKLSFFRNSTGLGRRGWGGGAGAAGPGRGREGPGTGGGASKGQRPGRAAGPGRGREGPAPTPKRRDQSAQISFNRIASIRLVSGAPPPSFAKP